MLGIGIRIANNWVWSSPKFIAQPNWLTIDIKSAFKGILFTYKLY